MLKVRDVEIKFCSVEDMKKEILERKEGAERHVFTCPMPRSSQRYSHPGE